MYKVLPCIGDTVLQKITIVSMVKVSYYQVSRTPFYYHVIKSILSEVELCADQDCA